MSPQSDAEIDAYIRKTAITAHHPAATCPMGLGPDAVLDPQMRVRGIERLRAVDASAMPDLVSGHLNAAVLMMAEKAADMIAGKTPLTDMAVQRMIPKSCRLFGQGHKQI